MSEMKPRLVWAAEYDDDSDYLSVMERLDTQGRHEGVTICRLHGEASADLIAEAGTVHHETGLTPRQLVERVKELEKALSAYESARAGLFSHTLSNGVFNAWGKAHDCRALNDAHLQARAALAKCEGVKACQSA